MAYLPISQLEAMYFVNEARKKKLEESKWVFKKPAIFNEFLTHKFLFIKFSYDNASEIQKNVTNLS